MKLLLYPLMYIYEIVVRFRNFLFDKGIMKSSEFDFPVIVVGNLRVGGTGKTPHVDYLIQLLSKEFNVGSLSRGYGRKTSGFREVNLLNKSYETGDESLQLKLKYPDIPVFVGENRVEAITQILFEHSELHCLILDDAFQHRALKAGVTILLSEYKKLFLDDKLLPLGRLREPIEGANRADIIIITKCPKYLRSIDQQAVIERINPRADIPVFFSFFKNGRLYPLAGHENVAYPSLVEEVLLVCGIANPKPLIDHLDENYEEISTLLFKDHHVYTKNDLHKIMQKFNSISCKNKIIITTEKDATRFKDVGDVPGWSKLPIYVSPIEVEFIGDDGKYFNEKIKNYVRENTGNE